MANNHPSASERFRQRIDRSSSQDGCWIWQGRKCKGGYGVFNDNKPVMVHRWAYEQFVGPIPEGLEVMHLCPGGGNPACANPAHLQPGTHQENMLYASVSGRLAKPLAKLSLDQVEEIRRLRQAGETLTSIGARFGVWHGTVSQICRYVTWRPLESEEKKNEG